MYVCPFVYVISLAYRLGAVRTNLFLWSGVRLLERKLTQKCILHYKLKVSISLIEIINFISCYNTNSISHCT